MYKQLPKIIVVSDCHEFEDIENHLNYIDEQIKCEELGFSAPMYVGVIYYKKITKKQIKDLLKKENIELE